MMDVIKVTGLRKNYGKRERAERAGFSGAAGGDFRVSWESTGQEKPLPWSASRDCVLLTEASVAVNGKMGIQLQSSSLPEQIRPMEAVRLFARWNRTAPDEKMLKALGIGELTAPYGRLSTGQKRRLHLALALAGNPEILVLDEPTAGLDVEGRVSLHEQIRQLRAAGKTILLASHDMAEVEELCDRIAILAGGKIAFTGTVEQLHAKMGKHYHLTIRTEEGEETYETDAIGETLLPLLLRYREKGIEINRLRADRGTLEEHFMHIAKGEWG
ncbi:MAG: ATP-binding cassette domain-containing protein [Lachnospiraceae bacterium]